LNWNIVYPVTFNTHTEFLHVERLAKEFFGEDKVGDFGMLPVKASEDFSFYLK